MAAMAVAPRTDRNHTADASPTLMPLLFNTLKHNLSRTLQAMMKGVNQLGYCLKILIITLEYQRQGTEGCSFLTSVFLSGERLSTFPQV